MLCEPKVRIERIFSYDYLSLFCEKNSDGTKNLRLKGNELFFRIERRIRNSDMTVIANFLLENPSIIKLDIPHNDIDDDGLQILVDVLLSQENFLQHLNLTCCNITNNGLEKLCNAWPTLKLKTLRLTGNKLGKYAGPPLETLIGNLKTLEVLDIGDTNQTLTTIPYYCSILQSGRGGNTTLKVLDLSTPIPSSDRYQYPPSHVADLVGETLRFNDTLVEIHLQKCQFDGHDIEILLYGLGRNKGLKLLDLGYNRINNLGAELLAEWLKNGHNLLGLNVAGNTIGAIGGNALSFAIPYSRLRLLDISQNVITDAALCALLKTIKKKRRMRILFIWGNDIGTESLKELDKQTKAGIYDGMLIDFKIFFADDRLQAAKYFSNEYKTSYYSQLDHGSVQELRIRRNNMESLFCKGRAKTKFLHYDRIQGTKECARDARYMPADWDECNLNLHEEQIN